MPRCVGKHKCRHMAVRRKENVFESDFKYDKTISLVLSSIVVFSFFAFLCKVFGKGFVIVANKLSGVEKSPTKIF